MKDVLSSLVDILELASRLPDSPIKQELWVKTRETLALARRK